MNEERAVLCATRAECDSFKPQRVNIYVVKLAFK